jgi:hypothetical protein
VNERDAGIRSALIVVATLLSIGGFIAAVAANYHLSTICWCAAFLCKWVECWLLERALVAAQLGDVVP